MEATNSTEGDPLKRGEDVAEDGRPPSAAELKMKKSCRNVLGFSEMSHLRTAMFFLSVFISLTIVFAFSFVIPCPVRPQYLTTWNRTFQQAATYDFLALEDASKDKVKDMLFVLKAKEGSGRNNTCEGLPSPCLFLIAVTGTDGQTIWERPLAPDFHWAQCGLYRDSHRDWDCLVSHSDQLTAVDKFTGKVWWHQASPAGPGATLPVLSVPGLGGEADGAVALVAPGPTQTTLVFLSGKTGVQIGSEVILDSSETVRHLLHTTKKNSHYLLLQKDTGLYGLPMWKIAANAEAGLDAGLKKDKLWESRANATTDLITIHESTTLKYILRTGKREETSNLVLVTGDQVLLIDGDTLKTLWTVRVSTVLGEPSFGHFNKDGVVDVVIEEDVGNDTKRVVLLDGKSGSVLWDVSLLATPNSPRPTSINTIKAFSIFTFWGAKSSNVSLSMFESRRSYMLHPRYTKVLLESTLVMDHIIAFKATLLERGRHACYLVLTGPDIEGEEGTVILRKQKLKLQITNSKIQRFGTLIETNEEIIEAYSRLRFSDE